MRVENKLVPELRFGEFVGDWKSTKLKDHVDELKGGASLKPSDFIEKSNFEVIPKKAIVQGGILNLDKINPTFCTKSFFDKNHNYIVNKTYLITTLRDLVPSAPTLGYIVQITECKSYILAQGVYGLKLNGDGLLENFLIQFTNRTKYRKTIFKLKVGSTQVHLRNKDFLNISINLPSLPEQQKIADFLTAVDSKIQALARKLDLLKEYKKGLMQKLFDARWVEVDGEMRFQPPTIRFKDDNGEEFVDWEENQIGQYIDFLSGYAFKSDEMTEIKSDHRLLRGVNISEGEMRHGNQYDRYYNNDANGLTKYVVKRDDIVISMDGSKVGRNSAMIKEEDGDLLVQRVARLRRKENASIRFIYQRINSPIFHKYVDKVKTSSGIPHISSKDIKSFKIGFPNFKEQTKIADFLTSIDDKINMQEQKLERMREWKKGLLQKMFV